MQPDTNIHHLNNASHSVPNPIPVSLDSQNKTCPFSLDHAVRLVNNSFPNQPCPGTLSIPNTIPNVKHLLNGYQITVRYNVIRKKLLITLPEYSGTQENADNVALTKIESLAALNNISSAKIPAYIGAIADINQYNPVADWITSKPWDEKDRLPELYDTLVERDGFPKSLKEIIIRRWLLSAVAAALKPSGFHCRGVLTLQGPQSIGKTSWINALVSDPLLRDEVIKLDHHLDAGNKDSVLTAVSHWIVEFGELESSFKKDIARLKGFITAPNDKIRRPYARGDSEYQRRTVFCASVNDANFLVDTTGNSRWWTIPVTSINFQHQIDMQQVFAQLAMDFKKGEQLAMGVDNPHQWWLTREEEAALAAQNIKHRAVSAVYERLLDAIDIDLDGECNIQAMTATEVLKEIGIGNPTNMQSKECAAFLREHCGESKRIQGRDKWRVPLIKESCAFTLQSSSHSQSHSHAKSAPSPKHPIRSDDDF